MKITFSSKLTQTFLALVFLFSAQTSSAAPLTPARIEEIASIYQNLLSLTVSSPRSPVQSLFAQTDTLTPQQITEATQTVRELLSHGERPHLVNRIVFLDQIRRGDPLQEREKYSIRFELGALDELIQNRLDQEDQKSNRWNHFRYQLASYGLVIGGSILGALHGPLTEADQAWAWPSLAGMLGAGISGVTYSTYQSMNWVPEKFTDSRTWSQQFKQFGKKTDLKIKARTQNRFFEHDLLLDEEVFPRIPHYSALLDWASSQTSLAPLSDWNAQEPNEDHAAIQVINETPAFPQTEPVNLILQKFHDQSLSNAFLNPLGAQDFQSAVHWIAEEMKKQPHSQWSHLVTRRLFFLALKRQAPQAMFELLRSRIGSLLPVLYPLYVSPLNKTLLLAAKKNHPELLKLLLTPNPRGSRAFSVFLLSSKTLKQARRIATRGGYTAILDQLVQLRARRPRLGAAPALTAEIRQTAGHDRRAERTLYITILQLKQRYQTAVERIFYHPEGTASIQRQIELQLQHLTRVNRLTPFEAAAAKALLDRIEAPFDENSPNYDSENLYSWNTEAKKIKTRELLQLAYLALEDRSAFRRQHGREMTEQDGNDNWSSWVKNALVDGSLAYAIDGGTRLDLSRIPSVSSCVPGVDHRIIHGLSGLHPDVKIDGGDNEESNLRVWERAKIASEAAKKAQFNNSVFDTLITEWIQNGANLSLDSSQLVQDYTTFVTERARKNFGEAFVGTEEFKTLLGTLAEYPEKILERTQTTPAGAS